MEMFNKKSFKITYGVILAVSFVLFCIINFVGFARFCDADMYQDVYASTLIWKSKNIFPDNWVFGNQYYIASTPLLASFLYGILGNSNMAMALATSIYTVAIFVSMSWMLKAVVKKEEGKSQKGAILFILVALIAVISGLNIVDTQQGQVFFLMTSYYSVYLVTISLVYGCYLRFLQNIKVNLFFVVLATLFSFATGCQSLRQTAIMVCPIIVVEGIRFFYKIIKKTYTKNDFRITAVMAGISIANVIGYSLITFVIKPAHHIVYGNTAIRHGGEIVEGFKTSVHELIEITGIKSLVGAYNYEKSIVLGLISVIVTIITVYAVVRSIICVLGKGREVSKKSDSAGGMLELLIVLLFLGVLGIGGLGTVMNVMVRHIYYFLWYPMSALSIYYVATRLKNKSELVYISVMTVILILSIAISYGSSAFKAFGAEEHEAKVCRLLEDEGIEYLYGHWSEVPLIAVYSDDKIVAGGWYEYILRPVNYLNPQDIYGEENKDVAAYLVLTEEEDEVRRVADDKGATLTVIYECDEYKIYRSTEVLIGELSDR